MIVLILNDLKAQNNKNCPKIKKNMYIQKSKNTKKYFK